jgi:hypothetical protein
VEPGESFHFEMNVFETRVSVRPLLKAAFSELAVEGLGPTRGRADLIGLEDQAHSFDLRAADPNAGRVLIAFLTPTELKGREGLSGDPTFSVLFARIRDRLSTLRSLYGAGPLDIDFRAMAERAGGIVTTRSDLRQIAVSRQSTRTGRRHGLDGFTGETEYAGALGEFIPYLIAAQWTGVGRQTVWGKGELSIQSIRPDER